MMTSFITKKEQEPSVMLAPPFWIIQMYSTLLKTRIKPGNRDRKFDLCIKGSLGSKKKYEIPREMNTIEN